MNPEDLSHSAAKRTAHPLRSVLRRALCALSIACLLPAASTAWASDADTYPSQPVRLVVGWSAGGYTDVLARAFAARLGEKWKQSVIVDNRPGASEIIGASFVANSKPDGLTLFLSTDQALQSNEYLYSKLPYNPSRSFAPIMRLATAPAALLVRADSPYQNLDQLIKAAKSTPGKLTYGSNGMGSQGHIIVNWFAVKAGIQLTHVPYKGGAPATQALMAGEIDMLPIGLGGLDLKASKLRALAITSSTRISTMPDLPTFVESGHDVDFQVMFALVAPASTPPAIVAKIAEDGKAILADPAFSRTQIERFGNFVVADDPRSFAEFLTKDAPRVRARIVAADVKLD